MVAAGLWLEMITLFDELSYSYLTFQIQAKRYVLLGLGAQPKEPIGELESDGDL